MTFDRRPNNPPYDGGASYGITQQRGSCCPIATGNSVVAAMNDSSNPNPRDAMETLERKSPHMSPESFKQAYDCVVAASPDRRVLARLMWIAGMYLDRHPSAFQLPRALAEELLASDDFDELLAGLKMICHSSASASETIAHFLEVMKRNTWEESDRISNVLDEVSGGAFPWRRLIIAPWGRPHTLSEATVGVEPT